MRNIFLTGLFLFSMMAGVSEGQVKLAVENCELKPGQGPAYARATQDLVEYLRAGTEDLPGNVYGAFREVAAAGERVSFVLEVEDLGEFEEFILARIAANQADEQRGALFRAVRSHLDERTCDWSFHLPAGVIPSDFQPQ